MQHSRVLSCSLERLINAAFKSSELFHTYMLKTNRHIRPIEFLIINYGNQVNFLSCKYIMYGCTSLRLLFFKKKQNLVELHFRYTQYSTIYCSYFCVYITYNISTSINAIASLIGKAFIYIPLLVSLLPTWRTEAMKRKKHIKYHELGATIILIQHFSFYSCVQININATAFH